jgi:hypothetical protein
MPPIDGAETMVEVMEILPAESTTSEPRVLLRELEGGSVRDRADTRRAAKDPNVASSLRGAVAPRRCRFRLFR